MVEQNQPEFQGVKRERFDKLLKNINFASKFTRAHHEKDFQSNKSPQKLKAGIKFPLAHLSPGQRDMLVGVLANASNVDYIEVTNAGELNVEALEPLVDVLIRSNTVKSLSLPGCIAVHHNIQTIIRLLKESSCLIRLKL